MTRFQANQLLDEHREGIRIHPIVEVTKALWICGDLGGTLSKYAKPPVDNGENPRISGLYMAQGTSIGE